MEVKWTYARGALKGGDLHEWMICANLVQQTDSAQSNCYTFPMLGKKVTTNSRNFKIAIIMYQYVSYQEESYQNPP